MFVITKVCAKQKVAGKQTAFGKKKHSMGGFHRAGTGKNKKVIEISPCLQAKELRF